MEHETTSPVRRARDDRASASESRLLRIVWAVAVASLVGGVWTWTLLTERDNAAWIWPAILGLASLPGKYLVFGTLNSNSPVGPWELMTLSVYVDFVVSLTIVVFLDFLRRMPGIGPALERVHARTRHVLEQFPRLARMAFFGVVVFIYLPLPASGSIGGTFVADLLGLSRWRGLAAVVTGCALVAATFGALATWVGAKAQTMLENPWVLVVSTIVFAIVVWIAWRRVRALLRER